MAQPTFPALKRFSEVEPVAPSYLWDPYLRAGNLNVIRGDGGAGKTMVVMAIAAALTLGKQPDQMPGILSCDGPSSVIYLGSEDDPENYRFRLDACGCDAEKVAFLSASDMPTIGATEAIRYYIREAGARLIIFDPIQAFLPSGIDINSTADMRPLLDGLRQVCRETSCTAVLVEHLNKATKMKAAYRGIGSVDIINSARSALMVGYHPSKPGLRVIKQLKSNAAFGPDIAFRIDDSGRFFWCGTCQVSEEELSNAGRAVSREPAVVSPVYNLISAIAAANPSGFSGNSTEILELALKYGISGISSPVSIGKSLPGIVEDLRREGIEVTQDSRRVFHIRRP